MSSDHPPNTSSSTFHHHQPPPPPHISPTPAAASSSSAARDYRKGNWTLHETLVLITAKKLDDERRTRGVGADTRHPCKTAELRWKWVENYCWEHGCYRSQNQCNDKWDNLLRDYKKVREYEAGSDGGDRPSYWVMEKHEKKDRNLPSNLLPEVFEALHEVVNRRFPQRTATTTATAVPPSAVVVRPLPPVFQPSAPPVAPTPPPAPPVSVEEVSGSSDTEGSESLHSDTKRRKVRNLGSSIVRSASVIARTLLACEEKREKRHRDVLELEERKLQMEENRTEMNRQGVAGLISAVNNLSDAIHALVSDRHDTR